MKGNSSTAAKNRYNKKKYDKISFVVYKGKRAKLRKAAQIKSQTLSRYIKTAVTQKFEDDTGEKIKL